MLEISSTAQRLFLLAARRSTGLRMRMDRANVLEVKDDEAAKRWPEDCLCHGERFSCANRLAGVAKVGDCGMMGA
jgi:hypothetical protein